MATIAQFVPPEISSDLEFPQREAAFFYGLFLRGHSPEQLRRDMLLWVGCIAGALEESEYKSKLKAEGFEQTSIEPRRVYQIADAREFLAGKGIDVDAMAREVDGKFMGAFIRAAKPTRGAPNCGPRCCS